MVPMKTYIKMPEVMRAPRDEGDSMPSMAKKMVINAMKKI